LVACGSFELRGAADVDIGNLSVARQIDIGGDHSYVGAAGRGGFG
jgi:hypothetical protein